MELNQYEIVLVNLDPTIGSEMKKTRPAVIISPNEMNQFLNTIIIAPITSNIRNYPTRLTINQVKIKGSVVLDQIRTIDKIRIVKKIASLTINEAIKVKGIIKEMFID